MIAMNEKANGVKLFALVAVLAMVVAGAAVIMNDDTTDAATGTQVYGGQTLEAPQTFTDVNIRVIEDLIIQNGGILTINGGNFTVEQDVTVTVRDGGQLIVDGGLVTVNGDVVITGTGATFTVGGAPAVEPGDEPVEYEDYGVIVNDSITVTRGGTLIAAEDSETSVLINNNGTLAIQRAGNSYGTISGLDIDVAVGGTFQLNGVVNGSMNVTSYSGTSDVYTSVTAEVRGTLPAEGARVTPSNLTFTATSNNITAYQKVDADRTSSQLVREYYLNITGTISNDNTVELKDVSSGITGLYYTQDAALNSSVRYDSAVQAKAVISNLAVADGGLTNGVYIQIPAEGAIAIQANSNNGTAGTITNTGVIELIGTLTAQNGATLSNTGVIAVNGGSATLAGFNTIDHVYGAYYTVNAAGVNATDTTYITDLATAIASAVEANVPVHVSSNGAVEDYDAYTVTGELTIPDYADLTVVDALAVAEGATLTIEGNAYVTINGTLYVNGTVVDNSLGLSESNMVFQVKIISEGNDVYTYTTLANALTMVESGTIYLYNEVTVSGTMTINENVTVQFADDLAGEAANAGIKFKDANSTLVVNGTLVINGNHGIDATVGDDYATITVNNMIKVQDYGSVTPMIDGAYFVGALGDDAEETMYITSVPVAVANSSDIEEYIMIYGNVAMGDVTFTKGDDIQSLTIVVVNVDEDDVTTGNITLANGADFTALGNFTGSVTDGANTVSFNKSANAKIGFHTEETAEGTISDMCITNYVDTENDVVYPITGEVTITAGTVTVQNGEAAVFEDLTIGADATLEVSGTVTVNAAEYKANLIPKEFPVYTEDAIANTFASFFVEGTLNVAEGGNVYGAIAVIDGTLNVAERAGTVDIDGAVINGTVTAETPVAFDIAMVNGTIDGKATVQALMAMPGSTVVADDINSGNAQTTTVYINGEVYTTVYAVTGTPISGIMIFVDVPGVQPASAVFYNDAAMTQAIPGIDIAGAFDDMVNNSDFSVSNLIRMLDFDVDVGAYENVYIAMDPAEVEGTVSVGTGLDLYIDNVRVTGGQDFVLSVGTHTVSFDVKAGYDGANATITFNGQTVQNGGSITITADMTEYTLVASGAAPSQGQVVIDQTGGDDGMGITDYLLIILVILVIVLAIFVALRMMRS